MSAVKDRANRNSEGARAIAALPALIITVAAHVPPDAFAFAIGTYGATVPTHLFKVVNCLFVGLEGLEKFEDVHGCTVFVRCATIP